MVGEREKGEREKGGGGGYEGWWAQKKHVDWTNETQ